MRVNDVSMHASLDWIKRAAKMFAQAPLQWMFITGAWFGFTFVAFLIPIIGIFINLLQPVFIAGMIAAAAHQTVTGKPDPTLLYSGFKKNLKRLIGLGAVELVLGLVVVIAAVIPLSIQLQASAVPFQSMKAEEQQLALMTILKANLWIPALAFGALSLIKGLLWFCPALLTRADMTLGHALRWSVYAFLSNFGAMALYGGVVVAILGMIFLLASTPLVIILPLVIMAVMPIFVISQYQGFLAVFDMDEAQGKPSDLVDQKNNNPGE